MNHVVCKFAMLISYSQVLIYDASMDNPFNDWRREHVDQGFAWRHGSVAFGTFHSVCASVEIITANRLVPLESVARVIRVPYIVEDQASLAVATVGFERAIDVPLGQYALTYEHKMSESDFDMICRFTFVPCDHVEPVILIADSELSHPPTPLLMEADPV